MKINKIIEKCQNLFDEITNMPTIFKEGEKSEKIKQFESEREQIEKLGVEMLDNLRNDEKERDEIYGILNRMDVIEELLGNLFKGEDEK